MRRIAIVFSLFAFFACTSTPTAPAPQPAPTPTPVPAPATQRSQNALTPVGSMPVTIAAPKIRVGLLIDQPEVTFPRTASGYSVVTDRGPSTLRRGFTVRAPLAEAAVRYAVQMAAISDQSSAQSLVESLRTETGMRVDMTFDPASGMYKILAGDFASSDAATAPRSQLTDRGYGRDLQVVRRPSSQPFEKRFELVDDEGRPAHGRRGDVVDFSDVGRDGHDRQAAVPHFGAAVHQSARPVERDQ